jgi:hypothetical protein
MRSRRGGAPGTGGFAISLGVGLAAIGVLMWGGVPGLPYVENGRWGGLR